MAKNAHLLILFALYPLLLSSQPSCWRTFTQIKNCRQFLETDNALWMATNGGILEFALPGRQLARHFTPFNTAFPTSSVIGMAADQRGTIWVATEKQVGKVEADGIISVPELVDGLAAAAGAQPQLSALLIGRDGQWWVGAHKNGLFRYDGRSWRQYAADAPELSVNNIQEDDQGNIWVSSNRGVAKVSDNSLAFLPLHPSLDGRPADGIAIDKENNIWISRGRQLFRFDGRETTEHNLRSYYGDQLSKPISQLSLGKDGRLYALADGNIYRLGREGWRKAAWSYPNQPVEAFHAGQDGAIWGFGNRFGGLKIWEMRRWTASSLPGLHLVSSKVSSFLETDDAVFLVSSSDLIRYEGEASKTLLENPRLGYTGVLAELPSGNLLHTYYHHGDMQLIADELDPQSGRRLNRAFCKVKQRVALLRSYAGEEGILIFSTRGVFLYSPEKQSLSTYRDVTLPAGRVKAIDMDDEGRLWAWNENGLFLLEGDSWVLFGQEDHPFQNAASIRGFRIGSDGRPWAVYSFYIYKYEKGAWQKVVHLPMNRIFCSDPFYLEFGPQGNLWLGRRNRLWKYDGREWMSVAAQALKQAGGWVSAIHASLDGKKLWVGSTSGFFELDIGCLSASGAVSNQGGTSGEVSGIDFSVSPNPFSRFLNIHLKRIGPEPFQLSMRNADGRTVMDRTHYEPQEHIFLDFTNQLSAGVYFITLAQGEEALTRQAVKGE